MTARLEVYKCNACGNIIEIMNSGGPVPECCGEAMNLQTENTVDAAKEKHVPVIEKISGGFKIKLGEVPHPMIDEHYIQWIEIIAGDKVYQQYLNPGDSPEAEFMIDADNITARAYCNLHGQWKA